MRSFDPSADDLSDPLVADAFADPGTHDAALLRAAAAGSRQAFALLMRRYECAVFGWASHALGSEAEAVELCTRVTRRAWAAAADAPKEVSRWLLEIAFDVAAELGAGGAGSDRDLDALWLGGIVREAFGHLPGDARRLLVDPQPWFGADEKARVLDAMEQLRALLVARGVHRET
ncbi:MAG: hypothetical protein U0U69_09535 [Acidimicrobiia bacterium]